MLVMAEPKGPHGRRHGLLRGPKSEMGWSGGIECGNGIFKSSPHVLAPANQHPKRGDEFGASLRWSRAGWLGRGISHLVGIQSRGSVNQDGVWTGSCRDPKKPSREDLHPLGLRRCDGEIHKGLDLSWYSPDWRSSASSGMGLAAPTIPTSLEI